MRKKNLLIAGFFCVGIVIYILIAWAAYGQEIQFSATVTDGSLYQNTNFGTVEVTDNNNYIQGRYQNELYAPIVDDIQYTYNFSSGAETSLSASSSFPVPVIKYDERIGTTQIDQTGEDCCQVAAGSEIQVNNISGLKTAASPGGTGVCCGVNYSISADSAQGMMAFGYAEHKTGQTTTVTPSEEEGEEDTITTVFGKTNVSFEVKARGQINNFIASVVSPLCPPAGEIPSGLETLFKICPWPINETILEGLALP